jgi:hypothetical protein
MKKIFLLSILVLLLTGCTSIEKDSLENIINDTVSSKVTTTNVNRNGYRYYLPRGLSIKNSSSFNETLTDQKYIYYLYVDVVSYLNKVDFSYNTNNEAKYSKTIEENNKLGYIEINNYKNDQYLIEIMYNYAKIEVVAYEKDINKCVTYAMVVLSSVTYNDYVIENYLSSSVLDSTEEEFDIFEIVGRDNYLQFTDEETSTDEAIDPDYIN